MIYPYTCKIKATVIHPHSPHPIAPPNLAPAADESGGGKDPATTSLSSLCGLACDMDKVDGITRGAVLNRLWDRSGLEKRVRQPNGSILGPGSTEIASARRSVFAGTPIDPRLQGKKKG